MKTRHCVVMSMLVAFGIGAIAVQAVAQNSGVKRTPLQTADFPTGYQTVAVMAEIGPGTCAGRHTHPGTEITYVMEGEAVLKVDGKPDQTIKTGSSFQLAPGVVHDACASSAGFKVLVIYTVEKGKPLASPAN